MGAKSAKNICGIIHVAIICQSTFKLPTRLLLRVPENHWEIYEHGYPRPRKQKRNKQHKLRKILRKNNLCRVKFYFYQALPDLIYCRDQLGLYNHIPSPKT